MCNAVGHCMGNGCMGGLLGKLSLRKDSCGLLGAKHKLLFVIDVTPRSRCTHVMQSTASWFLIALQVTSHVSLLIEELFWWVKICSWCVPQCYTPVLLPAVRAGGPHSGCHRQQWLGIYSCNRYCHNMVAAVLAVAKQGLMMMRCYCCVSVSLCPGVVVMNTTT